MTVTVSVLFAQMPVLASARVTLRPLEAADAEALYALYSHDAVAQYSDAEPLTAPEQGGELLDEFLEAYRHQRQARWAIMSKQEQALIGTCAMFAFDTASARCEIGYELDPAWWGRGLMKETLHTMLHYGFDTLALHRIEAIVTPENARSRGLLQRLGFRYEGTLRERFFFRGSYWGDAFYGLLNGELAALNLR